MQIFVKSLYLGLLNLLKFKTLRITFNRSYLAYYHTLICLLNRHSRITIEPFRNLRCSFRQQYIKHKQACL